MMQACGPVVRPHEILQTLIISIPQPSAAVKSFFELSRNFGAPFSLYPQQRVYLRRYSGAPLEARMAADGQTGHCRRLAAETRGDRAPMVPFPLLTPQTLLWTRLPPVARLNARGPQGRLVLQGYALDRSRAVRSDGASTLHCLDAHCYARRITQADLRV